MKLVYIAGPFRAPTAWEIERNVREAEDLGFAVIKLGAMPIIPHANTRYFHGSVPDSFFIEGTLELLKRSDILLAMPRWQESEGATGELIWARRRGMPVCESLGSLRSCLGLVQRY